MLSYYSGCSEGIRRFSGELYKFHLNPEYKPVRHNPKKVPIHHITQTAPVSKSRQQELRLATLSDPTLRSLAKTVYEGRDSQSLTPGPLCCRQNATQSTRDCILARNQQRHS